jgi:hypothetical protein
MNKTVFPSKEISKSLRKFTPEELEKTIKMVKEAYKTGLIESIDLDRFLLDFKFRDEVMQYWTIGIQTEKWYYRSRTGWIEASKPTGRLESLSDLKLTQTFAPEELRARKDTESILTPPPPPPPPPPQLDIRSEQQPKPATFTKSLTPKSRFCAHCGKSLNGTEKFCATCGTPLD